MPPRASEHPKDYLVLQNDPEAQLRFLLQFALRAPSSHNTQPWLFRAHESTIEVWGNERRALPASDADSRQFYVSLGCAIENILSAADYYGLPVEVRYFPDLTKPLLVARIAFGRLTVPADRQFDENHPIFSILRRHASREAFEEREISEEFVAAATAAAPSGVSVRFTGDAADRQKLTVIVGEATEEAFRDRGFCRELGSWIRPSLAAYRDGMPGYNIGIPWLLSFIVPFLIRHGNVGAAQRTMIEKMLGATPLMGIVATSGNEPRDWVMAGQTLERMWLMAERAGVSMGVLAAGIEIGDHYRHIQDVFKTSDRPQAFFRLGYANKVRPASPRLRLDEVMLA